MSFTQVLFIIHETYNPCEYESVCIHSFLLTSYIHLSNTHIVTTYILFTVSFVTGVPSMVCVLYIFREAYVDEYRNWFERG